MSDVAHTDQTRAPSRPASPLAPAPALDLLVDDVMARWPSTIRVFLDYRFMCVGCPIACFHTVADACREHFANPEKVLGSLRAAAEEDRV